MTDPALGWPTLCFAVKDLAATLEFCAGLGFRPVGGDPSQGWVALAAGPVEVALMGFLSADMLNLRGGDVPVIAGWLGGRGVPVFHILGHDPSAQTREEGPRAFNPAGWPDSWLNGPDGLPLPIEGSGDCLVEDPDGNRVYFDTVPAERARFVAGDASRARRSTGAGLPGRRCWGGCG
jgi:catechol 2,3-dioxygenase-like lactoylglutathione lyase family enzyme